MALWAVCSKTNITDYTLKKKGTSDAVQTPEVIIFIIL